MSFVQTRGSFSAGQKCGKTADALPWIVVLIKGIDLWHLNGGTQKSYAM